MKVRHALMLAAAMLSAGAAQAQFQKPEDAVKYRQSAFSVMGTHFARLGAMANSKVPRGGAYSPGNSCNSRSKPWKQRSTLKVPAYSKKISRTEFICSRVLGSVSETSGGVVSFKGVRVK